MSKGLHRSDDLSSASGAIATSAGGRPALKTRPGVGRPVRAPSPRKRSGRPEREYVVETDLPASLAITKAEVDAIEMFLGAEIDALLNSPGKRP